MGTFDPRRYWEERLARHYTHEGVGYLGLAESYNAWRYRVRRRVFMKEGGAPLHGSEPAARP